MFGRNDKIIVRADAMSGYDISIGSINLKSSPQDDLSLGAQAVSPQIMKAAAKDTIESPNLLCCMMSSKM